MPARQMPGVDVEALAIGRAQRATQSPNVLVYPGAQWCSLLTYTFNLLWAGFLSKREELGLTHFAMMHDDIVPETGWMDVLLREMEKNHADLVSAVVPIKDNRGLTSTATETNDVWNPRRLTMREVWDGTGDPFFDCGETVTSVQCPDLLVNTGLWVCDIRKPWCEKVWFEQRDELVREADGTFTVNTAPEDWNFSRAVKREGGVIAATRAVKLYHERPEYTNAKPWGAWAVDLDWSRDQRAVKAKHKG